MKKFATLVLALLATSATASTETPLPDGLWEQRGYSRLFNVENGKIAQMWTIGRDYCYPTKPYTESYSNLRKIGDDSFGIYESGGITEYIFDRADAPPAACTGKTYDSPDPVKNFDVLWRHFYENYKFFDLHDVDWVKSYRRFQPRITDKTSQAELWQVMTEMLAELQDGHVGLRGNVDGKARSWSAERKSSFATALKSFVDQSASKLPSDVQKGGLDAAKDYFEEGVMVKRHIKKDLLKNRYGAAFDEKVIWGGLNKDVGYLFVGSMNLAKNPKSVQDEIDQVAAIMDSQVIPALKKYKSLVLDMRFNGGGLDAVALRIASRLATQKCLAFTKQAPGGQLHGLKQTITIEPLGQHGAFNKPITMLTSSKTASATEIFVMAMRVQPHVISVGETTEGILSDGWGGRLPNGWEFSLSNEIYIAADGKNYEGIGFSPDVQKPVFTGPDIIAGLKPSMDEAISILTRNPPPTDGSCK
jgi:carboxyl-terminal processing protease